MQVVQIGGKGTLARQVWGPESFKWEGQLPQLNVTALTPLTHLGTPRTPLPPAIALLHGLRSTDPARKCEPPPEIETHHKGQRQS